MTQYIPVAIAFLLSLIFGFIFIPAILNFCKDRQLYDIPNQRKVHKTLTPRLGGVSFIPGMALSVLIVTSLMNVESSHTKVQISLWSIAFLISVILIYAVGIIDDFIGLNAKIKFFVQCITAITLPACGLYINNLYGFLGIHEIPYIIGAPITVFVIVFIDNAINLIDGIDGLSASLSAIALTGFLYCFANEGLRIYCLFIAALIGVLLPYLYFNIWGKTEKNRKIFMGDSGSLTLGFILGFLFIKLSMNTPLLSTPANERFLFAYSLLIVPVFDTVRVIIHRIRTRRPLFQADKNHIHHKLMKAGLSQHITLIIILGINIFFILFNLLLSRHMGINGVVLIDIVTFTVFQIVLTLFIGKKIIKPTE